MYSVIERIEMLNGTGALIHVNWYDDDPDVDRSARTFLSDQVIVPVPNLATLTPELIQEAVTKRANELSAKRAPAQDAVPEHVRNMIKRATPHGRVAPAKGR